MSIVSNVVVSTQWRWKNFAVYQGSSGPVAPKALPNPPSPPCLHDGGHLEARFVTHSTAQTTEGDFDHFDLQNT